MKNKGIFIFCLILSTSLTTTAAYSQSLAPISSSNSQPSPTNTILARDTNSNTDEILLRDSSGNVVVILTRNDNRTVIRDANGNVLYDEVKSEGLSRALTTNHLLDPELWFTFFLSALFGAIGGFVFELLNLQGNYEKKHDPTEDELAAKFAYASAKNVVDLGVLARLIIGAAAAPPAIVLLRPVIDNSAFALLALSVVAGSSGTAVFRSLQDRLLVGIAQKERDEAKAVAKLQEFELNASLIQPKLEQATAAFNKIDKTIKEGGNITPDDPTKLTFNNQLVLDPKDFEDVWKPLNEAKAMNAPLDDVINAFAELKKEVYRLAAANDRDSKPVIIIRTGGSLGIESLDKVKKLLNEANGIIQVAIAQRNRLPS